MRVSHNWSWLAKHHTAVGADKLMTAVEVATPVLIAVTAVVELVDT